MSNNRTHFIGSTPATPPPAPPRFSTKEIEDLQSLYSDGINSSLKRDWFFVKLFLLMVLSIIVMSWAVRSTAQGEIENPFVQVSSATTIATPFD